MHYYCYYYLCICRIYYTMFYDSNALWWLDREWEARINYYVWSVWLTSALCAALNNWPHSPHGNRFARSFVLYFSVCVGRTWLHGCRGQRMPGMVKLRSNRLQFINNTLIMCTRKLVVSFGWRLIHHLSFVQPLAHTRTLTHARHRFSFEWGKDCSA